MIMWYIYIYIYILLNHITIIDNININLIFIILDIYNAEIKFQNVLLECKDFDDIKISRIPKLLKIENKFTICEC